MFCEKMDNDESKHFDWLNFTVDDFMDAPSLASKLIAKSDAVSGFLYDQLGGPAQQDLANWKAGNLTVQNLETCLTKCLNAVITTSTIYDRQLFASVALRSKTKHVLNQQGQEANALRLNRLLLEDAFPMEISRGIEIEKRLLGEPITPYCTDAYNTLISVVHGVSLGALALVPDYRKMEGNVFFWANVCVAFVVICVIWHRYCVENQYIAWTLRLPDTIIPMLFGLVEVYMVLSVAGTPEDTCLSYALLFLLGSFAYSNSIKRHNNWKARTIYLEHFSELDPNFGDNFLKSFLSFARASLRKMLICAAISSIFFSVLDTGFWVRLGLSLDTARGFLFLFAVLSSGYFFCRNLRSHLDSDKSIKTKLGW